MKIQEISIKNFRLLKDTTLTLNEKSTVIVGRNNTGKTSLTELLRRIFGEKTLNFRLEDFSLSTHSSFWEAFRIRSEGGSEQDVRAALPTIEVNIKIKYDKASTTLGALSEFIIDLDPDNDVAIISLSYRLSNGKIDSLFEDLTFSDEAKATFYKALKERVPSLFSIYLYAIDPTDTTNIKELEWSKIQVFMKSGFINAQRGLDDETYKDKDVLGKILEVLFKAANSEDADANEKEVAKQLDEAVSGLQANIESGFSENLQKFLPALSLFGYPGLNDPGLSTETTIDTAGLLKDHTKIRYRGTGDITLPESFNGLGTRNLIYILFKLFEFYKEFKLSKGEPGIHLIFIEEPEAHLHPQMQEVFIRQLNTISKIFAEIDNNEEEWPVQFVLSTHSSHIANQADFDAIRYFLTGNISTSDSNNHTRIKDLSKGLEGEAKDVKEFLHKYMTLTRCDLLFADKAILVEGSTERIIMPVMIDKNDDGKEVHEKLSSQYITVMEVSGAYAHVFFSLLDFLEIKSLIVTDIDSTIQEKNKTKTSYKKCKVSQGTHTSNATIKEWFDVKGSTSLTASTLFTKTASDKTKNKKYLTYQIPENGMKICGRSFEAAFMLANSTLFPLKGKTDDEKEQEVWDNTIEINKTGFALDFSIGDTSWNVPHYIKEGLDWLANASNENIEEIKERASQTQQ